MPVSLLPINGIKLYVNDTGESDLPVVLCLHSLFLDSRMFDGFVERARGKYRVIRPEFRGQARSDGRETDIITMDQDADDIFALMDYMGLDRVNLLAQSMGGDVAARLAGRQPQRFTSLVMAGSSCRSEPDEQRDRFMAWIGKAGEQGFINDSLQETVEVMFGPTSRSSTDPERVAAVELWTERINAVPRSLYPAMKGVILRENAVPLLPNITCPALIISGEGDTARPPSWGKEVADGIPNSEFLLLENVGHSPTLEVPSFIYPIILAFFDKHNS